MKKTTNTGRPDDSASDLPVGKDVSSEDADKSLLEQLTIAAILEHRCRVDEVNRIEEQIQAGTSDPKGARSESDDLTRRAHRLRKELTAHQLGLNSLIDRLGYIPKVVANDPRLN